MAEEIRKYINLEERYALYGENGYYIRPYIICTALVDELKLSMSYEEIKEFIKTANITLTSEQIKTFLTNEINKEQLELKEPLEEENKEKGKDMVVVSGYCFEPYSLQYFKTYVSILKEKCKSLFAILDNLEQISSEKMTEEQWQTILNLDFHINENGDIYFADAVSLLDAMVYAVRDLHDRVMQGNDPKTYITCKEPRHQLLKDDLTVSEIYPRKEVENIPHWMKENFLIDKKGERQSDFVLRKSIKPPAKS